MRILTGILLVMFAISGMAQSNKNLQNRPGKKNETKFQGTDLAQRTWQGIPGIERSAKGRVFVFNGVLLIGKCRAGNLTLQKTDTSKSEVRWLGIYDFDFKLFNEPLLDYDLTVSDLIQKYFFKPTREWLENRGMLHRTQPYGLNMDILEASGNASIPETEQLYSEGSEGFLKLVTNMHSI